MCKYKKGDECVVIGKEGYHNFAIGDIVMIKEAYGDVDTNYLCVKSDSRSAMYIRETELVLLIKEPV